MQPALTAAMQSNLKGREVADLDGVLRAARAFFAEAPRRFEDVRAHLLATVLADGFAAAT